MTARNALVLVNGVPAELPAGDTLSGASVTFATSREVSATKAVRADDARLRTPFAINYLGDNPDLEIDAAGWNVYVDAAGAQPVDGTGGTASPILTAVRTAATSLRGANYLMLTKPGVNCQGQGVSRDFTIDEADKNKALSLSFDLIGNPDAGLWSIWIYQPSSGQMMPGSGKQIVANGQVVLQFSTNSATDYRLCIHVTSTQGGGASIAVDGFYCGPIYLPNVNAMSNLDDMGAITLGATVTAPTKGTIVRDKVWRKQIGDMGFFRYEYEQSAAGTAGSVDYLFSLPSGLSFDSTKVEFSTAAYAGYPFVRLQIGEQSFVSDGTYIYEAFVVPYDATRFRIFVFNLNGTGLVYLGSGAFPLSSAIIRLSATFSAPIAGWSGTTAVQPGSRYLWAQRFAANAVRVTARAPATFGEYRALYNNATDQAPTIAPSQANGFYINDVATAGNIQTYEIYVGQGKRVVLDAYLNAGRTGFVGTDVFLGAVYYGTMLSYDTATGVAHVWSLMSGYAGLNSAWAGVQQLYFDLCVADDPVAIALAPSVGVKARTGAGQVLTGGTTDVIFGTVDDSAGGGYNAATGIYTCPVAGRYSVCAVLTPTTSTANPGLYVNGTLVDAGTYGVVGGDAAAILSTQVRCAQGTQLSIRNWYNSVTLTTNPVKNWLAIARIGD